MFLYEYYNNEIIGIDVFFDKYKYKKDAPEESLYDPDYHKKYITSNKGETKWKVSFYKLLCVYP